MGLGLGVDQIAGIIGAVGQQAINYFGARMNNEFARENYDYGAWTNYHYNEMAAGNADLRTRWLYRDLYSPKAQLKMLKEAGLSPSIYFGEGAAGMQGQTGAQGAGPAGPIPQTFGMNPVSLAEIQKTLAETEKIKEETKTERGDNKRGAAEINNILANTTNTELKSIGQEYENSLQMIRTTIAASTEETEIQIKAQELARLTAATNKLIDEGRSAKIKGDIDEATYNDVVNTVHENYMNLVADTLLKKTQKRLMEHQINLTDAQAKAIIAGIVQRSAEIEIESKNYEVTRDKLIKQVEQWAIENGYTERGQNIEIAKIIANAIVDLKRSNDSKGAIKGGALMHLLTLLIKIAPK